jgi:hypothetical protein
MQTGLNQVPGERIQKGVAAGGLRGAGWCTCVGAGAGVHACAHVCVRGGEWLEGPEGAGGGGGGGRGAHRLRNFTRLHSGCVRACVRACVRNRSLKLLLWRGRIIILHKADSSGADSGRPEAKGVTVAPNLSASRPTPA